MTPRVFTIPSSVPFLPALIGALREGRLMPGLGAGPLALADATIYLPTRRACRLAAAAFLDAPGVDAAVLPRIVPIGDIDEDELAFADQATGAAALDALDLPPALGGLKRRLLLARLILAWAKQLESLSGAPPLVVHNPAAALALADDLARLMDDMITREVPWERFDRLVPAQYDEYWQVTLKFLAIAREHWPQILAAHGAIEPAARRDRMIAAEAARLAAKGPPVIAAGSTGSMPATAKLLATIAGLANGAVVLPGLDTELDEASWQAVGAAPGHPQFAMHALLARLGLARSEVAALEAPSPHGREIVLSEALRPAAATDKWRTRLGEDRFGSALERALADIGVIAAANAEEEALAIAVVLREAIAEPGRTAALVTPDRALARRVAVNLARWDVGADDSGGDALAETTAGVLARAVVQAALEGLAPAPLLALAKHKLARFGAEPARHARAVAALERAILRGPRPRPGSAGLADALAGFHDQLMRLRRGEPSAIHRAEPRAALSEAQLEEARALLERIKSALAPLEDAAGTCEFADLAARHRDAVRRASADETGDAAAFAGPDGAALAEAFDELCAQVDAVPFAVARGDYAELFRLAIDDRVVRRPGMPGSRVRILGPLEARLTGVDRVVIGGLVEGVWPGESRTDAWLSRPMRETVGLDPPERRIGLAAHDFAQLLGAREVFLTYAARLGGAPTVASRFVQRLAAVAGDATWKKAVERGERYCDIARSLDAPKAAPQPCARPAPRPPRAARPKSLSVTEVEDWLRDPYTIYAKHVLRLPRLDPVDDPPGAAERGSVVHGGIGDFATLYADALPADPYAELVRLGRARFAALDDFPEVRAFWWLRYQRIARWFADFERERRPAIATTYAERRGVLEIDIGGEIFRLTGRADRIERLNAGGYAILDFKTGAPPSDPQVASGLAPQLTLEAAMLRRGAFADIAAGGSVAALIYVRLSGGEPPGEDHTVALKNGPDAAAEEALAKLTGLIARFADENTAYHPLMLSMWSKRYGTYDDLARVKEWSAGTDDEIQP